jgi:hypothetical protein
MPSRRLPAVLLPLLSFPLVAAAAPAGNSASPEPPLAGLVVLLRFQEQEKLQLPPADFVSQAINQQISDFYGHVTNWKVRPMTFIVTEYFTPAKGFTAYDWWSNGNWENHFTLLREVSAALARGTLRAKGQSGKPEPVDLSVLSRTADGRVLSAGTTYFVDAAGSGGVFGRANGNDAFWPQEKDVEATLARKFGCRLASYSSGFVIGTYGRTDRPEEVDVGAQIHEIGHAFLGWPDIDPKCHNYGNDWEIVKRLSTRNKSGPSAVIRDCSRLPNGSTIQISVGDWDVWGFQNPGSAGEYIVFENICAKGYTYAFAKDHPRHNLLCYRIDTRKQVQVNVPDLAQATWADGRPVGFTIKDVSLPDDVMSLTLVSDVPGEPRKEGTAGGMKGYPVELFEQPGLQGPVGAFGAGTYYASWMPRMGTKPRAASSLRLQPGFRVTLCDGPRLQGATCMISNPGSQPLAVDLAAKGFDRRTASLLVKPLPAATGKP